jgi:hypothetical protein
VTAAEGQLIREALFEVEPPVVVIRRVVSPPIDEELQAAVVTVTVSVTLPVSSVRSTRVDVLLRRSMFVRVSFLNPAPSALTAYVPGCRSGNVLFPLSLVVDW